MLRTSKTSGFTLAELMVVVVLIGIVTALILPEMRGSYEDALLRGTARKLVDACNLAYSRSVTANRDHRLRLDLSRGKYFIEEKSAEGPQAFVPLQHDAGGEGTIDSRISIQIREAMEPPQEPPASAAST